jgi:bisanhydrobacterioruberin hydratase
VKAESKNILLLFLIHFVGILGYISPFSNSFRQLSSISILAIITIIIYSQPNKSLKSYLVYSIIIFCGYLIEIIGVSTGEIFGSYQYGITLGRKILNVPPIIGVNWLMLLMATGDLVNRFKFNIFIASLLGAFLLVVLDILIEPVAIYHDFWKWDENLIPSQNYVAWFIVSFLLHLFHLKMIPKEKNNPASLLYVFQFFFFLALNLYFV